MDTTNIKKEIQNLVFDHFVNSSDYNGIPLRTVGDTLEIDYSQCIDLLKELVVEDLISIVSSTNPHIIGFHPHSINDQCGMLEEAKSTTFSEQSFGDLVFRTEETEFPICLYPSTTFLKLNRDLSAFGNAEFSKRLALGMPQLELAFFDIEVLERYASDPRYEFKFNNYSGDIYCKYDNHDQPLVREEDEIFLKSFGLGYDEKGYRLAVVPYAYLNDLSPEHQVYWKGKEAIGKCTVVREYIENIIHGRWVSCQSIFSGFIAEQNCLNELCEVIFGKKLFNVSYKKEERPREFTFFFKPTKKNYLDFILLLDKMISDNINKDFFRGSIDLEEIVPVENGMAERRQKGTLRLFEEWLRREYSGANDAIDAIFKIFKRIRKDRQEPAHKITINEYDREYDKRQKDMIIDAYTAMMNLRAAFASHPLAESFQVPKWLEQRMVKPF